MSDSSPPQTDPLHEWIHDLIEERLTEESRAKLEQSIESDPEARRRVADALHDHATLQWDSVATGSPEELPLETAAPVVRARARWVPWAAAAALSLLAWVVGRGLDPAAPTFVTLTESEAARWESSAWPTAPGSRMGEGKLHLLRGIATLQFDSGAEVILEAPASLHLDDQMNATLDYGTVVAEVPESAHGFQIHTPSARIIDHGTRFAVNVDARNGTTSTQVFEGLVEVLKPDDNEGIRLKGGQRNRVEAGTIAPTESGIEEPVSIPPTERRGSDWQILTTRDGRGQDGYVVSADSNGHESDVLLLLKAASNEKGPHRKSYLRFDLDELDIDQVESAELTLRFHPSGWGFASGVASSEFVVHALINDGLDDWTTSSLEWSTAPANVDDASSLDPERTTEIARFNVPRGVQQGDFTIGGEALARAIETDANRQLTLILTRSTVETRSGGLVHSIASSRHPYLPAPTLAVKGR